MDDLITRLTHDGQTVTAPAGTIKCAQGVRPHPSDWTHWLFAPWRTDLMQLTTRCGKRAHRFVLEAEGKDVDCPECVAIGPSPLTDVQPHLPAPVSPRRSVFDTSEVEAYWHSRNNPEG